MTVTWQNNDPDAVDAAATAAALALKADKAGTTLTGATVDAVTPAQFDLIANGAKATATVTLNAFADWTTGMTIVLPTIGSHTIQVDGTPGDIDVRTLTEAQAKAAIDSYLSTHAGATCDVVTTGSSMVVTAKAYGTALNGLGVYGTLLSAIGTMAGGLPAQVSNPQPSNQQQASRVVYDGALNGADVTFPNLAAGEPPLDPTKKYVFDITLNDNSANENVQLQPNGSAANCNCWYGLNTGVIYPADFLEIGSTLAGQSTHLFATIEPRSGGSSFVHSKSTIMETLVSGQTPVVWMNGHTKTNYTTMKLIFSASTGTGWLKVTEVKP